MRFTHSMHLTSPRTKSPGMGKPAEAAARPHSCARPSAQVSGLQSPQAEGCGRRACPEVALGLPLEIPSLLGAVGTSEPPLFCLNGPFSPGIWRTMAPLCRQAVPVLGTSMATKWGLANASWAQAQVPGHCHQGTSTCHFAHAVPPA